MVFMAMLPIGLLVAGLTAVSLDDALLVTGVSAVAMLLAAVLLVRERAGHAFDPEVAACMAEGAEEILAPSWPPHSLVSRVTTAFQVGAHSRPRSIDAVHRVSPAIEHDEVAPLGFREAGRLGPLAFERFADVLGEVAKSGQVVVLGSEAAIKAAN